MLVLLATVSRAFSLSLQRFIFLCIYGSLESVDRLIGVVRPHDHRAHVVSVGTARLEPKIVVHPFSRSSRQPFYLENVGARRFDGT
jgi:hypothetical protein